jgi:ABC-type glutathione transport system ATPase component
MAYLKAGSGVGKTTLAKIIMGLTRADSVNFTLCDIAANDRSPRSLWRKRIWGRRASMVFQHADEALDLMCTVRETFKGLPGDGPRSDDEIESHLRELFDTVTPQFLAAIVGSLSGGQKQRLNLLRTLALDTDLIILDEPLNGLDFDSARRVLSMLERKRAQGAAMLMISHNEEIIENIVSSDSIYYMD